MERKANNILDQMLSIQHISYFLVSDAIVEIPVRFTLLKHVSKF